MRPRAYHDRYATAGGDKLRHLIGDSVFYWFERRGELLRLEVLQPTADSYELRVIGPGGVETVESFADAKDLAKRQEEWVRSISGRGWVGPYGWII